MRYIINRCRIYAQRVMDFVDGPVVSIDSDPEAIFTQATQQTFAICQGSSLPIPWLLFESSLFPTQGIKLSVKIGTVGPELLN